MMSRQLQLTALLSRYWALETVRLHPTYLVTLLIGIAGLATVVGLRAKQGEGAGLGVVYLIGLWAVAAPLCRSHISDDVRLGYGALWLQKPLSPVQLYTARWLAVLAVGLAASVATTLAVVPAALLGSYELVDVLGLLLVLGWIPLLLVTLNFLCSAAGARNSALFAYGVVFMGAALPGLSDSLDLGRGRDVLAFVLPPMEVLLDGVLALERSGIAESVSGLGRLILYLAVSGVLGLLLALRSVGRQAAGG